MRRLTVPVVALLMAIAALSMAGCPPPTAKPPPADADAAANQPDSPFDAAVLGDATSTGLFPQCTAACAVMAKLGCPEAAPDAGKGCYQLCVDAEGSSSFNLRPSCISACKDVECVRACGTVRCQK